MERKLNVYGIESSSMRLLPSDYVKLAKNPATVSLVSSSPSFRG